ncbi:hypothetical protein BH18ACT15_BH18ACT15_14310 [soil metagenome]
MDAKLDHGPVGLERDYLDDLTPAQADAELLRRGAELAELDDEDEIERLAAIADQGDEEVAQRAMPDSEGWTSEQRAEVIVSWQARRRWMARYSIRPGETADEWRERRIAQEVTEHGCAPLVIPARRREDVVAVDLATLSRRKRRRLYRSAGHKSLFHARRHVLRVLRVDRAGPRQGAHERWSPHPSRR